MFGDGSKRLTRREAMAASLRTAAIVGMGGVALSGNDAPADDAAVGQRWLVVAAHPDDEAKAAPLLLTERKPEDKVVVLVMRLCGEGPPHDRKSWTREEAIATRSREMEQAAEVLKAELQWWLPPHPANKNIALAPDTLAKMAALLKQIRPTRIVTHWREDSHPDHVGTAELVSEALRQLETRGGMRIYRFAQPGKEKVQKEFAPNHYVDISDPSVLASVLWARVSHRSQSDLSLAQQYMRSFREHGRKAGVEYAFGYVVERL